MGQEKDFYSFDEVKDKFIGKAGTSERKKYEAKLNAHLAKKGVTPQPQNI